MKKQPFYWLSTLTVVLSLLSPCAWAIDNIKADAILDKIEDGSVVESKNIQAYIDDAEALISSTDRTRKVRLLKAKCWVHDFSDAKQIDKAIAFSSYWMKQAEVANYPRTKIDLLLCQSWFRELKGQEEAAYLGYKEALIQAKKINNQRLLADAYSLIGELQSFQGNYSLALGNLIKAHEIYQALNLGYWQLYNLSAIATSYRRFGDPQSAIHYYKKILQIYNTEVNETQAILIQRAIAFSLEELGLYQEAVQKHLANYHYYRTHKQALQQAISATEMAGALIQLKEITQARQYLEEARQSITTTVNNSSNHFHYYFLDLNDNRHTWYSLKSQLLISFKLSHNPPRSTQWETSISN